MAINQKKLLLLCFILYSLTISVSADRFRVCRAGECRWSDELFSSYANCEECPTIMGEVRTNIKTFVHKSNSLARTLCHLSADDAKCLLQAETAKDLVITMTNQMFPIDSSESSKRFTCAHLLHLCPDIDSKGNELKDGSWSCTSCEIFLDPLFTILNTFLPKLNTAMSTILCPKKDADCLSEFTDVFQVSGLLGDFIKHKRPAASICNVLKCIT